MTPFRQLMKKYIFLELTPFEIKKMKNMIQETDDESIANEIRELWNVYSHKLPLDATSMESIIKNKDPYFTFHPHENKVLSLLKNTAAVLFPIFFAFSIYTYVNMPETDRMPKDCIVSVEKGQQSTLILPDSTRVYLNSDSQLKYSSDFGISQRRIELTGEAYFEVAKNQEMPFVVSASNIDVKVLGTTFNINMSEDKKTIETSLLEGSVEVRNTITDKSVKLIPNQKAIYNTVTGLMTIAETDLIAETGWMYKELIFRSEPLPMVLKAIEKFYGCRFIVEGNYPKELFTGRFKQENIQDILQNLQEHYRFHYHKQGNEFTITFV